MYVKMMDVREELKLEASYEPYVKSLVARLNRRLGHNPIVGELWVRLRPPNEQELETDLERPSLTRFYRIGTMIEVVEVLTDFVEVFCAGRTLTLGRADFLDSYVQINDWPGRRSSSPPFSKVDVLDVFEKT